MSLFTLWKAVPCRRIPLTSMLYFAIFQPALWRGFVVLFIETPFFDLHQCYRILTVSHFQFTCYLQDLDCLPYSIYMLFTGSWQSPFFNLHVIYKILTVSLFSIYMLLTVSLFFIYMLFTESWQSPFFNLHVIYRILTVSLLQFTCYSGFTCPFFNLQGSWQSPFFNLHVINSLPSFYLHVIYRILTVSLFLFTCFLQDLHSVPFSIYMLFAGSWQSPFFNFHVIYRILTVSLFQFTCYLQILISFFEWQSWQSLFWFTCSLLQDLQNLDSLPFSIYMIYILTSLF